RTASTSASATARLRAIHLLVAARGLAIDLLAAIDAAQRIGALLRPVDLAAAGTVGNPLAASGPVGDALPAARSVGGALSTAGTRRPVGDAAARAGAGPIGRAPRVLQTAAELVALCSTGTLRLVEALARGIVAIGDALAVLRPVLPAFTAAARAGA